MYRLDKRLKSGRRNICIECRRTSDNNAYSLNPSFFKTKQRVSDLKKFYGITLAEFNSLFSAQNGKCKSCGTHQSELNRSLCVDHNHKTKKVRGLLCNRCNQALGLIKENFDTALNLAKYIQQDQGVI